VGFDDMGQLMIIWFGFCQILGGGFIMKQCIEFKEAHDSVRWEFMYNILIEFGIPKTW
jgi:hypothetical protein